jgi:MinD-like ATPase involved in chromosome partitioning or flagellar assembly
VARGALTVVGAASGGCGATEVAIGLAAAAAGRGEGAVLVDADDVRASVAQRLGLPVWPNIRAAVDAFHEAPERLPWTLTPHPAGGFEVLCGLSNPADWSMLRPAEVVGVCRDLAALRHHVVVNVGPGVEDLGWLGEPERFGVTRALLAEADVLVGVSVPTPVGVARLLAWISEVRSLTDGRPAHLVLNRAPAGRFRRAEVEEELRRAGSPASVTFLPEDPRVGTAAWEGRLPEPGPFRRAVASLAEAALPVFVAPQRRRRRLLGRLTR